MWHGFRRNILISLSFLLFAGVAMSATAENGSKNLDSCYTFDEPTQVFLSATWCASSSLGSQSGTHYGPENLIRDGAWCEGAVGDGIGETITLSYQPYPTDSSAPAFDRLVVENGHSKSLQAFSDNSRAKEIEIKTDTGHRWVKRLKDQRQPQDVTLGTEISLGKRTVTILDV